MRFEQSAKTSDPVVGGVEDFILKLVKPEQFQKAWSPMLVTELGIVMEVKPEPEKASLPMLVTELGMTVFLHPAISVPVPVSIIALQLFLES